MAITATAPMALPTDMPEIVPGDTDALSSLCSPLSVGKALNAEEAVKLVRGAVGVGSCIIVDVGMSGYCLGSPTARDPVVLRLYQLLTSVAPVLSQYKMY